MNTDMTSTGLTALAQMAPVNQTLEILRYIIRALAHTLRIHIYHSVFH